MRKKNIFIGVLLKSATVRRNCVTQHDPPQEETASIEAALLGGVQKSRDEKGRTRDGEQLREEETLICFLLLLAKQRNFQLRNLLLHPLLKALTAWLSCQKNLMRCLHWELISSQPTLENERDLVPHLHHPKDGFVRRGKLPKQRDKRIVREGRIRGFSMFQTHNLRRTWLRTFRELHYGKKDDFDPPQDHRRTPIVFEENVEDFLRFHNVGFFNETEQKFNNLALSPRCTTTFHYQRPTPDFLLFEPILINGKMVNWIECKHFYGSSLFSDITNQLPFENRSQHVDVAALAKQPMFEVRKKMNRYVEHYGPGAVVFSHGFSRDLDYGEDVLILDGSKLNR